MWIILTKKNEGTTVLVNTDHIYRIEAEKEGSTIFFTSATAHVRETPNEILKMISAAVRR